MTSDQVRYAVIPTHNRHDLLDNLVRSLSQQCDIIIVVDNASTPAVDVTAFRKYDVHVVVIRDDEQPPNLSRLWNVGFDAARDHARAGELSTWDVAVFNDDCIVPERWYDNVSRALREHPSAAIASGVMFGNLSSPLFKTQPDGDLYTRMTPWAFVMRGEYELRADESLRWWWGDTDFDWTARSRGGVLIIPGNVVQNTLANSTTHGPLAEQAGRDGETFRQKWGWRPW